MKRLIISICASMAVFLVRSQDIAIVYGETAKIFNEYSIQHKTSSFYSYAQLDENANIFTQTIAETKIWKDLSGHIEIRTDFKQVTPICGLSYFIGNDNWFTNLQALARYEKEYMPQISAVGASSYWKVTAEYIVDIWGKKDVNSYTELRLYYMLNPKIGIGYYGTTSYIGQFESQHNILIKIKI